MAYVKGSSTTLANLLSDIRAACTANGWTLSGEVLHKGAVFQRVWLNGNFIDSLGGTGIDGSNNLTGTPTAGSNSRIGSPSPGIAPLVFPLTYHVFIGTAPDEVFVVVNYSTDYYQWLAWGKSSISMPGSGGWFSGSMDNTPSFAGGVSLQLGSSSGYGGRGVQSGVCCPALFHSHYQAGVFGESVNHGIGTTVNGWGGGDINAASYRVPLDFMLPSAWNSEAVLLPMQAFTTNYGSGKVAMVLDVAHARALRIDNHQPGDIITLGADSWMVFAWYKKAAAESSTSSGRLGWAIRYDGA